MSDYSVLDILIHDEATVEGELVFAGTRDLYEDHYYFRNKPSKNKRARHAQRAAKRDGARII